MSIVAMLTVNWGYHLYMKIFAPHARAYSFVDNMTLTARNVALVAQGHFAMVTFSALCGLSMDEEQTYVWD